MVQESENDEAWSLETLQEISAADTGRQLNIETIESIKPLDMQMGVWPLKTVPDTLYEPLFGQPEPTEAEVETAGGNPENVPPMQTYAILDAAKVFGLPEMLDTSDLMCRCLFKGDAYDELKDMAPWIVRLENGNDFTRKLFTAGDEPWFMWDKEPGIFIRSRADLDTLWRHFRKFTRVQDENGKWFYFRFWEPHTAAVYFKAIKADQSLWAHWFFSNLKDRVFTLIAIETTPAKAFIIQSPIVASHSGSTVFTLGEAERLSLTKNRIEADLTELSLLLTKSFPQKASEFTSDDMDRMVRKSASRMGDFGIKQRDHLFRLAALDLHTDGAFERTDPDGRLRQILEADIPEADKMRRLTERINELDDPE